MRIGIVAAALAACFIMSAASYAQGADEIVRVMETRLFTDGKAKISLVFTDEKGAKERYEMMTYSRQRNQYIIVRFTAPARVVGNDLLMLERNVWSYDAKSDRVLRIPSNQSFGGTGFSYGDVLRLNYSDNYAATIVETRAGGGWALELVAKERDAPYYRVRMDVDAEYRPIKGVCYGRSGDIIKEMAYGNVRDAGGGVKPLTVTVTSPLEPGRVSVLTIEREAPKDYPASVFNKRNLSARLEEQY